MILPNLVGQVAAATDKTQCVEMKSQDGRHELWEGIQRNLIGCVVHLILRHVDLEDRFVNTPGKLRT